MSKFNQTKTMKTVNRCGHAAYDMTDKAKLVTQALTTFFCEPKYYGDNSAELITTAQKVIATDPQFVANLARYARKEMHLRSVAHALAVLVAHENASKPYIKAVIANVVERPDDITEILALYISAFGKPIPNGLKKALGDALGKFDSYRISKYSSEKKTVKFIDVLRLTHVKPKTPEQQDLFNAIINDTLPVAERWETELSARGNTKEVWEKLIAERKIGYMAALRNLRSMIKAAPDNLDDIINMIADENAVKNSKQLPMRFYSAYREMLDLRACSSKVIDALETAIEYSVANMPHIPGKTAIAIDVSGSMSMPISKNSKLRCSDIARLLAALASKLCDEYIIYTFDTELRQVTFPKKSSILQSALSIDCDGGGTDLTLPIDEMLANNIRADRLIMFSDNEINRGIIIGDKPTAFGTCQILADKYRKTINPDFWVHAVDLMGYGTQQFIGDKTNVIAGWSERVMEFIMLAELGIQSQVTAIENYK